MRGDGSHVWNRHRARSHVRWRPFWLRGRGCSEDWLKPGLQTQSPALIAATGCSIRRQFRVQVCTPYRCVGHRRPGSTCGGLRHASRVSLRAAGQPAWPPRCQGRQGNRQRGAVAGNWPSVALAQAIAERHKHRTNKVLCRRGPSLQMAKSRGGGIGRLSPAGGLARRPGGNREAISAGLAMPYADAVWPTSPPDPGARELAA